MKKPIKCKLGDLGEARSELAKTIMIPGNTHRKHMDRGSPAFMAPETQVDSQLLATADLNDLKKIDIWALIMTIYMIINPDQLYPFAQINCILLRGILKKSVKNLIVLEKFSF